MVYVMNDELYHHGIKGQKWGIRRYQNEDGSLTDAGKKRYGPSGQQYLEAKAARREANREYDKAYNKAYSKNYQAYSFNKAKRDAKQKDWENALDKAAAWREANVKYKSAKEKMKADRTREKLENKVSSKAQRRGASPETSQKLGKAYADRVFADKQYTKDWKKVYNEWSFGKEHKSRVDKMMESLNDYWIADDIYQHTKLDANTEIRKANGWR